MNKTFFITLLVVGAIFKTRGAEWIDPNTGSTWYFRKQGSGVEIYNNDSAAIVPSPRGSLLIPPILNGNVVIGIGKRAFYNCKEVTEIILPQTIKTIGDYAFAYCASWKGRLIIPEGVVDIGKGSFFNCNGLTEVVLPKSVKNIGAGAFYARRESVYISSMASWCACKFSGITSNPLHFSKGNLYLNGDLVSNLIIPDGTIEIREAAFTGARCIKSVTIPNSVTHIYDWAFSWCKGLTDIEIPEGVRRIGHAAFDCCDSITNVFIPSSVTEIEDSAFRYCGNLKSFTVSPDNQKYMAVRGLLLSKDGKVLVSVAGGLTKVELPDYVEIIGKGAFDSMIGLKCVKLSKNTVKIEDRAFAECKIANVELPESLMSIGGRAFYRCDRLSEVIIPRNVKEIGLEAFHGCREIQSFLVTDGNPVYRSKNGFLTNNAGTDIISVPEGLSCLKIPVGVKRIPDQMCLRNYGLKSVEIPDSVCQIGNGAFSNCWGLEEVQVGTSVTNIEYGAFEGCRKLKSITFRGNEPSVKLGAFRDVVATCVIYCDKDKGWAEDSKEWNGMRKIYYRRKKDVGITP